MNLPTYLLSIKFISQFFKYFLLSQINKSAQNYIKAIIILYNQQASNIQAITGSADHIEQDLNTVVNQPASGKLRQYTTVSSQCERFS